MVEQIRILGVPVGAYTFEEYFRDVDEALQTPGCTPTYAVNAHYLNLTYRHRDYLDALRRGQYNYVDGASLQLAAKLQGKRFPDRLATWTLWPMFCERAQKNGESFFLLGGEEGLIEAARDKTLEQYPNLNICGVHHGYIDIDDPEPIRMINELKPDYLWVGMGDPLQVLWIDKHRENLNCRLALSCGGLFKFVAGHVTRTSEGMQKSGFEWLGRLIREPKLWSRYMFGLPAFGLRALAGQLFGHRKKL